MANETEDAPTNSASESHATSADVERNPTDEDKNEKLLNDAVQFLPTDAVKDLLSKEVCLRCIFRLFGMQVPICSSLSVKSLLCHVLGEQADLHQNISSVEPNICRSCLGILQFTYCGDKERVVENESACDFAVAIAELVKKEGHQIDSFSLEVSMPPTILENENKLSLYVKRKYRSEAWFKDRSISECSSTKDALKFALTNPLETLLDVKCGINAKNCLDTVKDKSAITGVENSVVSTTEVIPVDEKSSNGLQDNEPSETHEFPLKKVNEPCRLECLCFRTPIYFGGRYLKYSRNVSQTRWIIDEERMGEASIEEIIGGNILPMCRGDSYKFHAAGREDIDVRMLGSGRPFLFEIQNAREVPSELLVKEIESKINSLENKLVRVKNLKIVGSQGWTLMREGEAEKQKQYAALVWISRPLQDEDFQTISSLKETVRCYASFICYFHLLSKQWAGSAT
ncbi:tRNA pseudouridine(55) synthase [Citrus sinensis]|nr:tRNA pseudouridine(55) synthase [Citrus sinensis]